ncbi:hypothetical protein J4H86_23165 [Spiractinospora alimapuensis]|uniref:hypothetical protein n=1 Tax=Spiractinospora alimapuensis TaxID=2820884 RepID=UPI001F15FCD6|nr:hypothetical protein [Spiractinospora alimapuensis]QVQ51644.1 hypothetical protein J4H86_23165 [Spiractinospora alimapuensis]
MMTGVLVESVTGPDGSFDIRHFARTAVGCHRDSLALDAFAEKPLSPPTLRALRYVRDVERSTMRYLRRVLVTPTHKDAQVTAFLTTWAFEKYWVADALDALFEAHTNLPLEPARTPVPWSRLRATQDRFTPIWRSFTDNTLGESVIAVHMAVGAADEWMTRAAYREIARVERHPELDSILEVVQDIKTRHLAFFGGRARDLLTGSPLGRRLTRTRMRHGRWPVCAREEPAAESAAFFRRVFARDPEVARTVDARIRSLPGLEDLTLMRATVARYAP